ncbi:Imm32 family immunity protein [Nocardioides bruguierae]|uniref:Imm32 family immunity protein n=1 Tax=Nocardioides bruguierae TaxID=2945102 RepID=UPI002020771C|nr:hypothetical protein [Nocardioides bruguierae]MCL8026022.1 hypothetical protein [Nocardioides bruguierae]
MTSGDGTTLLISVDIRQVDEHGLVSNWDDDTKLWLSFQEQDRTIGIAGNSAALTSLARHLLTLAQADAMPGHNLYWEPESGWFETNEAGLHISLVE